MEAETAYFGDQPHARRRAKPGPRHFVVQTKANSESYACQHLKRDNFSVYFPRVVRRRAHAGRVDYVVRPLFSRYIFVRDDGRGPFFFRSAPGVSCVVTFGSEPALIHQQYIDAIRARESDDGLIRLDDGPARFRRGDKVRINDNGLFDGWSAVFDHATSEGRSQVLISMMGRMVKYEIDDELLEERA